MRVPGLGRRHHVGRGDDRAHAGERGVESDVRFAGWVSDTDLEGFYRAAACFVFPSLYEGFGLPVLEAMQRGVPVACSDAASLPEVAGDAALLIQPTDEESIADGMRQVLTDATRAHDLRRRGQQRAAGFTWDRTAKETVAVYREAAG